MDELNKDDITIAQSIDYASAFEEKLRIAKRMLDIDYQHTYIASLVDLPIAYVKGLQSKYEEAMQIARQVIDRSFWDNEVTKLFLSIFGEGENPSISNMQEKLLRMHKEKVEAAQRKMRMRVAYRLLDEFMSVDEIAQLTGLETQEVRYLIDICRIREEQHERSARKIAKKLLEAQVNQELISEATDLSSEDLSQLQRQIDLLSNEDKYYGEEDDEEYHGEDNEECSDEDQEYYGEDEEENEEYYDEDELRDEDDDEELYHFEYSFLKNKKTEE